MSNIINSINGINSVPKKNSKEDIKKLVKYVNNEPLKDIPDTFTSTIKGATPMVGLFEGIPLLNLLKRNKKVSGKFVSQSMKDLQALNKQSAKQLLHHEKSLVDYLLDVNKSKDTYSAIKKAAKKEFQEQGFSKLYNLKQTIKSSKTVKTITDKLSNLKQTIKSSKTVKTITDKLSNLMKKSATASGEAAVKETVKASTKSASKFSKLFKTSGASMMLVLSGIIEFTTEVLPTFKELGKEKGIKQTLKSAVRVAGDTAGFVGGEMIGSAIGAAIGSVVPVVGTAIGGVLGFVGGLMGSFVMGKISRAVTGKTEREKAKELEEQNQINNLENDKKALSELKELAVQKIEQEYDSTGDVSNDSKIALEAYKNLNSMNIFV